MSTTSTQHGQVPKLRPPESWDEVDAHLARLRHLESRLAGVDADYDEKLVKLQEAKADAARDLIAEKGLLEQQVYGYMKAARAHLPPTQKSVKLQHGQVGWRKGSVKVKLTSSEAFTLQALKAQGRLDCIKVTEKLDKTAVKTLPGPARVQAGIALEQSEATFIKLKAEEVVAPPDAGGEA